MTDADYANVQELLANTPAPAESQLNRLEQVAGGIGLYMNMNKIQFMRFKQDGTISTRSGKFLKLVDQFTYLNSNISSTESGANIFLAKVWNAFEGLSII